VFRLISFYLGEKLCLKFCTVINSYGKSIFIKTKTAAFLLKYNFSAWFCHGLTRKDKVNVDMFGHETQTAEKAFFAAASGIGLINV
jgi:hypothetical protein